eukprot:6267306-Amphidinium_carterae.1
MQRTSNQVSSTVRMTAPNQVSMETLGMTASLCSIVATPILPLKASAHWPRISRQEKFDVRHPVHMATILAQEHTVERHPCNWHTPPGDMQVPPPRFCEDGADSIAVAASSGEDKSRLQLLPSYSAMLQM